MQALKKRGWAVTIGENLNGAEMNELIETFVEDIGKGSEVCGLCMSVSVRCQHLTVLFALQALFFFAGHGMAVDKFNYICPTDDSEKWDESDVMHKSIKVDWLLSKMQRRKPAVSVMILDCCRASPYRGCARGTLNERSVCSWLSG